MNSPTQCPWSGYAPASISWCEERLCAWVVEPSNAWSNLAFLVGAFFIFREARRRRSILLFTAALASVMLSLMSFAFHATGTRWAELADVSAMYLISAVAITQLCVRAGWVRDAGALAVYFLVWAFSSGLMAVSGSNGIVLYIGQVFFVLGFEIFLYRRRTAPIRYDWLKGMMLSLGGGFAIWITDKTGTLCIPSNHYVTGHAVWHVATAFAVVCYALFMAQFSPLPNERAAPTGAPAPS